MTKDVKILELRRMGWTYREIAAKLGLSADYVYTSLNRSMRDLILAQRDEAEVLQAVEGERLHLAMKAIGEKVRRGELACIDRWIRLSESYRKLYGLDAPTVIKADLRFQALERMTDDELEKLAAQATEARGETIIDVVSDDPVGPPAGEGGTSAEAV